MAKRKPKEETEQKAEVKEEPAKTRKPKAPTTKELLSQARAQLEKDQSDKKCYENQHAISMIDVALYWLEKRGKE